MKKYILLGSILLAGAFSACDYNDHNFDGLDELSKPSNVEQYQDTFNAATDVPVIVSALRSNSNKADSVLANNLNSAKVFSEGVPAAQLIPYLLKSRYVAADVGSSTLVTYPYNHGRDTVASALSSDSYSLKDTDYKLVWGDDYVNSFTPEKSPEISIPVVLSENISSPKKGNFVNVEYYYSQKEPVLTTVESVFLEEDLQDEEVSSTNPVNIEGWINKDIQGSLAWQCRTYQDGNYLQISSYRSGVVNDVWLITKPIDLKDAVSPEFSFDIVVGNFNGECLSILVSDNFDGNEANIAAATWTDVTSEFTLPAPASGYTKWATAGTANLTSYAGKNIYIAFRYSGNDSSEGTKVTTTYQLDNIKVSEDVSGYDVEEKQLQYAAYLYDGSKWSVAAQNVITLQPSDYDAMGETYLSKGNAALKLPVYLKLKYPFAQQGDSKYVVYKTSRTANYADEYIFDKHKDVWVLNDFIEIRSEQFVLARVDGEKQWIFDPTIVVDMQNAVTGSAEYQVVVDYVKTHQAIENPNLSRYADSEYYYGFSARYRNVSYRDQDRSNDPLYPINGTKPEKEEFCNNRTVEGIILYLTLRYPDAQPLVNGVTQFAQIRLNVYSSHVYNYSNEIWTYTLECIGDKEWKFIQRESENKTIERAE